MELGQLHPKTEAGRALFSLIIQDTSIQRVLDVGCWNGLGSTLCVMDAMVHRKKPLVCVAIEANKAMWEKAVKHWRFKSVDSQLQILYGRISKTMMTRNEIERHPLFPKVKDHYKLWYDQDVKDFEASPLIRLPAPCDLVILDGGEFCGAADLDAALELNPRYLFLDDVEVMKNCETAIRLGKLGWKMIWHTRERNGSVLFQKKT